MSSNFQQQHCSGENNSGNLPVCTSIKETTVGDGQYREKLHAADD